MKRIFISIFSIILFTNIIFANKIPVSHVPANHYGVVHINYKKIIGSVKINEFEKLLIHNLSIVMPKKSFLKAEKIIKEMFPELKKQGFDIYNDIKDIVISVGKENFSDAFLIAISGNFDQELFNDFMNKTIKAKTINFQGYKIYVSSENSRDKSYYHRYSEKLVIASSKPEIIVKSIKAKKSGRNIMKNRSFVNIYTRSIKNKAINVVLNIKQLNLSSQNRRRGRGRRGQGQLGMFMQILANLEAVTLNIDFPKRYSIHAKIICNNANTASQIGMLAQQQLPNLPTTINQELFSINRRIRLLKRKIKAGRTYLKRSIYILQHKKFFLLMAAYAGKRIRVITNSNIVKIDFVWPLSFVQRAINRSGLPYNIRKTLR